MTDKQIIINDYFNIMRDENGRIFGIQEFGDIRQLIKDIIEQNEYIQAKEQELQEAMDNYVQLDLQRVKEYNELVDLYKAKEQECEELKHEVELMMDCASCKVDEYKKTLAEIKEIAETISLPMGTGKSCNRVILAKQILQKISEVENENS